MNKFILYCLRFALLLHKETKETEMNLLKELRRKDHKHILGALDIFKYIGPGLLVTVGFIDPGN